MPALTVLIVGVLITSALTVAAQVVHNNNEKRLLHQRVREVAAVLTTAIGTTQNRLATTANIVEATSADNKSFIRTWNPAIAAGQPFTSI